MVQVRPGEIEVHGEDADREDALLRQDNVGVDVLSSVVQQVESDGIGEPLDKAHF